MNNWQWYDWVLFIVCWAMIPGCLALRCYLEKRKPR